MTIALTVILVLVTFVLEKMGNTQSASFMLEHGAVFWEYIEEGEYYRLFTGMFLHFGVDHLVNNMAMLLILGFQLEQMLGHVKTGALFFICGLVGNICSVTYYAAVGEYAVCAGASGAIYGLMGALCVLLATEQAYRTKDLPKRILLLLVLVVYSSVSQPEIDIAAHVGGLLCGFLLGGLFALYKRHVQKKKNQIFY